MNKILLQLWEESIDGETRPDGASLHIDMENRTEYVNSIYNTRDINNIPKEYESAVSSPIEVFVDDILFKEVIKESNIRIQQYELNNLIELSILNTEQFIH